MEVKESAPAVSLGEIEIAAPPERVWEVLTRIEDWPSWNPEVTSASLEGPLAPGSVFRWTADSRTITSTLREVERPRLIGWTGKTLGIRAIHVYRLEPTAGGTIARSEESWEGVLAVFFRGRIQKTLDRATEAGLIRLKEAAEAGV